MPSSELSKTYSAKEIESKWYQHWEAQKFFVPNDGSSSPSYVIVIPPPNVTGILHMGHGLNNAIQDILIRWRRLKGDKALWVPGTDHAGIATQNVVEKKLAKEGKKRHDVGREKFVSEVWKWKEEYGSTIVHQLRQLGASCGWTRERFTMDEGLSHAVREVFFRLFEEGLIYRGHYLINWCPRCTTALSDEEVEHQEVEGALYEFRYPIKDSDEFVTIATTRPETMLGDTAVAINPKDERYQHLRGKKLILPLIHREISIIEDDFVDPDFGTGCVKVTPAHDPNDFEMGKRHGLEEINIFTEHAVINENGGSYQGSDRFEARKKVIADLKSLGLFEGEKKHTHSIGHCYRCQTVVEPYYSKQWFVKMKPLAEKAIQAAESGDLKFHPNRWTKVYLNWMHNIRDWCISRQIWWGHRIPIWYDPDGNAYAAHSEDEAKQKAREKLGKEVPLEQDPDVLDTWFSSWLWPFSTLGWPEKTQDLKTYYPTATLVTGPDILFFWVARMVMAGLYCMGEIPFRDVYLHGTVRDETGRKMSKSLGNIIDPLEIVDEIGADALRFVVISLTSQGQDVYLSKQRFDGGRNFTNKIWNAARFAFMNLEGFKEGSTTLKIKGEDLSIVNRWILRELAIAIKNMDQALESYRFNDACLTLQRFIWGEFCDWYLELQKPVFYGDRGEEERQNSQKVLFFLMDKMLRILHPIMPFITEELWQHLKQFTDETLGESLMLSTWPETESMMGGEDSESIKVIGALKEIVSSIRDVKARYKIQNAKDACVVLKPLSGDFTHLFLENQEDIKSLSRISKITIEDSFQLQAGWLRLKVPTALRDFEGYIFLGESFDVANERKKLEKELERLQNFFTGIEKKLSNQAFVSKAPETVIAKEKQKREDLALKIQNLQTEIEEL